MIDAPAPSKRPWHFPIPPDALAYHVHPGGDSDFEQAGRLEDGRVIAANGYLALAVESFLPAEAAPEASEAFRKRASQIPWGTFPKFDKAPWRPLDDAGLALWKYGPKPIWERSRTRYHLRRAPAVRVGAGAGAVAQLALLQLCARLPRAQVWTAGSFGEPVFVRFNGGLAYLAHCPALDPPAFSILRPKTDPLTKAFLY